MYELKVQVSKVLGKCTADPPMKRGDYLLVRDGNISIPGGGYICLWALQSVLPLITPKEREICERHDEDWMWRVHHAQCPDPDGRVVFKIERVRKLDTASGPGAEPVEAVPSVPNPCGPPPLAAADESAGTGEAASGQPGPGRLRDLTVVVEEVRGGCTASLRPGDHFIVRDGRLYIPPGRHFCLYALHAALPLLPAKQRRVEAGDWLATAHRVICPDPAGNVIMRIVPAQKR